MKSFKTFLEEDYTPISGRLGTNPGGVHHDEHGNKFYIKHYQNGDQAKVEALTGKLYNHMGIHTISPSYENIEGKHSVVTPWNENLKQMPKHEFHGLNPEQNRQVGRMYHAAVLTKNWDIVGTEHDNIVKDQSTGNLHAVDHGGAFHFRALGGHKDYGPDIAEADSLRHNNFPSGHVFGHVLKNKDAFQAGYEAVANMDMDHVHSLFANSGLHNWEHLHSNFVARREKLLQLHP